MPQSLSNVLVHAVFSTLHRRPFLREELRSDAFAYLAATLNNDGSTVLCVGGYEDHVHLLFRLSRTGTLAQTIGNVKAASSRWLKTKGLEAFAWQSGYAAFSVGRGEIDRVARYIENQAEHHTKLDFQDEIRRFFEEFGVEYDERYVWE